MADSPGLRPRAVIALRILCMTGLAALSGCAVNPNTGRNQLIALPAAQIAHADMGFTLAAVATSLAASSPCAPKDHDEAAAGTGVSACPVAGNLAKFSRQVERMGAELATEAKHLVPDLFTRIHAFQITVEPGIGEGTSSSAGGRIALSADLAALDPTDDVVAFLIAREMGHVIARHGEEDSGARMVFSALTAIVPIGGLVLKFATSMLGSQVLKASWAQRQRHDADEIALALLDRSGRSPGIIAFNLKVGLNRERLPRGEWGEYFAQSAQRVTAIALAWPQGQHLAAVK